MTLLLTMGGDRHECRITPLGDRDFWFEFGEQRRLVSFMEVDDFMLVSIDGVTRPVRTLVREGVCVVIHKGRNHVIKRVDPLEPPRQPALREGGFLAPLSARVTRIFVEKGARVSKGVPLLMLEAMKMEIAISAPGEGTIVGILCQEGHCVREGELLVEMASD